MVETATKGDTEKEEGDHCGAEQGQATGAATLAEAEEKCATRIGVRFRASSGRDQSAARARAKSGGRLWVHARLDPRYEDPRARDEDDRG